jgi:hypothetical protein
MNANKLPLAKKLVERLSVYSKISKPTNKQTSKVFDDLLLVLGLPQPSKELYVYFLKPSVISELIRILHNEFRPLRKDIAELRKLSYINSPYFYRIRELGNYGDYPHKNFTRRNQSYVVQNGLPYLITKNNMNTEDSAGTFYTEISHITRNEIKFAATYLANEASTGMCLYFEGNTRDANAQIIVDVPESIRVQFLVEYSTLFNSVDSDYYLYGVKHPLPTSQSYEYREFDVTDANFLKFYDAFSINDYLLLRVATYLVKGTMLWRPEPYREEALANIFFALEGCLLMLQRKHDLRFDKIDRRNLPKLFNELFAQGEGLFDFIDEAVGWGGRRASIVHPQLSAEYSWLPPLSFEDFRDYQEIVRMILTYVLTDHIYSDFRKSSL